MRTLVVGLGNEERGDDAAGLEAARRLAPILAEEADVRAYPGEPVDLIPWLAEADRVVIVDAARSGLPPGSVRRYLPFREPLPPRGLGSSSHAFDLLIAIELARALGAAPRELILYAVEGERFAFGSGCSPSVIDALDEVVDRVTHDVRPAFEPSRDPQRHRAENASPPKDHE